MATDFPSTSWSALRQLRDGSSPEYQRQLARLAGLYWKPVFCAIRYGWSRGSDEARDLTQEFFSSTMLDPALYRGFAPGRGSFRAYLKGAIAHFMSHVVRAAGRQKRGSGHASLSLDGDVPELAELLPDSTAATPETIFDAAWSGVVFARALARVESALRAEGKGETWEAFRRYDVEGESETLSYEALAAELGWSARQVKRALANGRAALRAALADEVSGYVDGPQDLEQELRALLPG